MAGSAVLSPNRVKASPAANPVFLWVPRRTRLTIFSCPTPPGRPIISIPNPSRNVLARAMRATGAMESGSLKKQLRLSPTIVYVTSEKAPIGQGAFDGFQFFDRPAPSQKARKRQGQRINSSMIMTSLVVSAKPSPRRFRVIRGMITKLRDSIRSSQLGKRGCRR